MRLTTLQSVHKPIDYNTQSVFDLEWDELAQVLLYRRNVKNREDAGLFNLIAFKDINDPTVQLGRKYIYKNGSWANSVVPEDCGSTNSYRFKNAVVLRIHPLSETLNNLKISVLNSNIPNFSNIRQGFTIVSVGEFYDADDKTTRRITASKFLDSPSYVFDYTAFIDY